MKPRTTLALLAIFILLLATVILVEHRSEKAKEKKESAEKLTDFKAAEVEKISLKNENGQITIRRDEQGHWQIIEPLEAEADDYEASSLAENFASLRFDRVVEENASDPGVYEIPKKEVSLWIKGKNEPVIIQLGMENPLDGSLYARRADRPQVVLLPSYLKYSLDKKLFDLRKKDILKFDTAKVQSIELRAKEVSWKARRTEEGWEFSQPLKALASRYRIDNLLDSLSGLRAKEFLAEQKDQEKLKVYGLDRPEFKVILGLPESQELIFFINQKDGKVAATSSLSSKIIEVESQIITDLNRKIDELREKKVALFNSWEAVAVSIKKADLSLEAIKEKIKEKGREQEKWFLIMSEGKKEQADESRIESFLRKLEYLEASEFIDNPGNLSEYGLDKAGVEIVIRVKSAEKNEREIRLLVGKENTEKHQVVIKNQELAYLFLTGSDFLKDLPEKPEDWKAVETGSEK